MLINSTPAFYYFCYIPIWFPETAILIACHVAFQIILRLGYYKETKETITRSDDIHYVKSHLPLTISLSLSFSLVYATTHSLTHPVCVCVVCVCACVCVCVCMCMCLGLCMSLSLSLSLSLSNIKINWHKYHKSYIQSHLSATEGQTNLYVEHSIMTRVSNPSWASLTSLHL